MNIDFGMLTREESHQGFISEFLKELEKGLRNMNNEIKEYTIDRFEGDFAVLGTVLFILSAIYLVGNIFKHRKSLQ